MDEGEIKKKLTPEAYAVLREGATEAPFSGKLSEPDADGIYQCLVCGNALFARDHKFESGSGWPSFDEAIAGAIEYIDDTSHGMHRVEVRCAQCHSHLGHVFDDGPRDTTGKRYCINSVCLR